MNKEKLNERIFKRINIELDNQKKQGKIFISDEQIDMLIDEILKDEINTTKKTNQWVEVNSNLDLPKRKEMYFVIRGNDITIEYFDGEFYNYQGVNVSHYQTITKPSLP